ncbi:MAG: type II toxin-antitoxin system RelE/ParE family toxin [Pseudomonadota bacterium]
MRYELSPDAIKDIREIWNYTVDKWGEKQANNYIKNIFECFEEIIARDVVYKKLFIDDKEIKLVRHEHHYIFFIVKKDPIIVRVLHKKMDFISALNKRLPV